MGRKLDGQDGVVKLCRRRKIRRHHPPVHINQDVIGPNPGLRQHGAEKRGLVFAVAVTVGEDILGRVRPKSSDANLNGHVTHVVLHELRESADFIHRRRGVSRELLHLLVDLRRGLATRCGEPSVPTPNVLPTARFPRTRGTVRRIVRNTQPTGHGLPDGHIRFVLNRGQVIHLPCPFTPSELGGLLRRMVQPKRIKFPALRQVELEARLPHRKLFLKIPVVLKDVGSALALILVADHVGRFGSGNFDDFGLRVIVQVLGGEARLHRFFFFHFVIFARFR